MTKPDDDSQKKKEIDFFKPNYNQTYTGDEVQKYYYDSWEKLKIDVDFLKSFVF
jgi:hypothetical protein